MYRRRGGRRSLEATELNITAFMNLMVILVPFLLITAVFSRLAILELNLPGASSEPAENPAETMQLEITVRAARIEVGDRNGGLLSRIDNVDGEYDLDRLAEKLREVKKINPDKLDCT
ncbi:MAG: biopolymer transporter ExbD, partial [Pseudomonadota bacterium]